MKKLLFRLLPVILCAALALSIPAQAQETAAPSAGGLVDGQPLVNYEVNTRDELKVLLNELLEARDDSHFTVTCPKGIETLVGEGFAGQIVPVVREMMAELGDTTATGADYNGMNVLRIESGVLDGKLYVHAVYLTSQAEEEELDRHCAQVIEDLQLDGMSDYEKIRAIYEHVGTSYVYDMSLSIFSAYEGVQTGSMVCHGYSILMNKLLALADIPCRMITGWASSGVAHSWNIVQLGHQWYNLDVTWDACEKAGEAMRWDYFLKGSRNFTDHHRDAAFNTLGYTLRQPMSEADYPLLRTVIKTQSTHLSGLSIRKGMQLPLRAFVNGAYDEVHLTSTDPTVASVDENGVLTAHSVGMCSIMGRTDREDIVPAMVPVYVVDLTQASSWAQPEVTDYYLRSLLPRTLTSDFQKPVTRAEAARCIYPLLERAGVLNGGAFRGFMDLDAHPDELFIGMLSGLGVFDGVSVTEFDPEGLLTREQTAKVLVRVAQLLEGERLTARAKPDCADVASISKWALYDVAVAMEHGILYGTGGGNFSPKAPMTREQLICTLERMAENFF